MRNPLWPLEEERPIEYDNLDESEMESLEKLQSWMPSKSDIPDKKETKDKETVSKADHDQRVSELKERNGKLQKKIDELKDEKAKVAEARDSYKKAMETRADELEAEKQKVQQLRTENGDLQDQLNKLKGSQNRDIVSGVEHRALKSEFDKFKKLSDSDMSALKEELSAALEKIAELESQLSEERESVKTVDEPEQSRPAISWKDIVVTRPEPSVLKSDAFSHRVYRVVLARDGSHISMVPDVEGGAECYDGEIDLPKLPELVPYRDVEEYRSKLMDDDSIIIELM